eukprot:CAMPEP_0197655942 /NCGR_PEP_ID=MMETSP1338-20131121/39766_1 /TAXON_ID=43686 ORGANISM="Pelagodinium beii, Strain RCC1491" /NCGR_SAMPLE_ID=MMETSP1338 /ASSEMBLY_ACC=CAM_ASM_000754 /LENGTH=448 /DNA_ID=CAMNT_0043231695 /DNA_START=39 /DNA_END=1385 /DNA_ORIENTATION=+
MEAQGSEASEVLAEMREVMARKPGPVGAVDDEVPPLPTPLRMRRSLSPVSPSSRSGAADSGSRAGASACKAKEVTQLEVSAPIRPSKMVGLVAGIVLLAVAVWLKPQHGGYKPSTAEEGFGHGVSNRTVATVEQEPEAKPKLASLVAESLACPGRRGDILDVLAGAPYEFGHDLENDQDAFYRYPRLAASVAKGKADEAGGAAENELKKAVLGLAATGAGWAPGLRLRVLEALHAPCEAAETCGGAHPLALEVDEDFTSPLAKSHWLHQGLLDFGALFGFPHLKARASLFRSRPPTVVLSSSPASPAIAASRDCLAVRGSNTSLALRMTGGVATVRQLVIEQPPRWAALRPKSLPRHFSVYGTPAEAFNVGGSAPYTELLGNFEYLPARSAVQAFLLPRPAQVKGLRLLFEGPGWGENYTCIYRVKAYEGSGSVCSGHRVAAAAPRSD